MASSSDTINLIRTKTGNSSRLDEIEENLKKAAFIGITGFIFFGLTIGLTYVYFSGRYQALTDEKNQLISKISSQKTKEGLYLSIKLRTQTVQKAIANQRPWAELLDNLSNIAKPPVLSAISVDDKSKIVVKFISSSISELNSVVTSLISEAQNNQIRNPQLLSLQIDKDGKIQMEVAFTVVF